MLNLPTVKEEFGYIPTSVWYLNKPREIRKLVADEGDPRGLLKSGGLRYSEFNPAVAKRIIEYWSKPWDLIIDPFAGRTTRGMVAILLNRSYEGYEIAPKTYEQTLSTLTAFRERSLVMAFGEEKPRCGFKLHLGDGTTMDETGDNAADLVFTCPPYHDLEKYESTRGQLSDIEDYDVFLNKIDTCIANIYRVLKSRGYCVWVCADWRKENKFYNFHGDCIRSFIEHGFRLWDIIINVLRSPTERFPAIAASKRYTVKKHEYILVFKVER